MMEELEVLTLARDRLYEKAREDAGMLVNAQRKFVRGYADSISDSVNKIEWLTEKIEELLDWKEEENV